MGWNSTIVVMHDSLGTIENDPDFGKSLSQAILRHSSRSVIATNRRMTDVVARGAGAIDVNAASVIESHHADACMLVAVGGNMGRNLGYMGHDIMSDEEILRALADKMGYRIVKKAKKS